MKHIVLILLSIFSAFFLKAQSTNISTLFQSNFKKAEALYSQLAYRNALELYHAVAEKDSSNYEARQRIADCYFRLGNIKEAERWYAALAIAPGISPHYKYHYAEALSMQGKYADAQQWYSEYSTATKDSRAHSKVAFINHLNYYFRDSALYEIKTEPFNSDQSDFAPQFYNKGVVFVSARNQDKFIKRQSVSALNDVEAMLNIFYAAKDSAKENETSFFYHQHLNSRYHDGPIAFYDGGKKVVFSRSNLNEGKPVNNMGKIHLKLYFAELDANNQMKHIAPFQYNDDSYSNGHPWMSEAGDHLYFSSDRPGGQGGTDIYSSEKIDGNWTTPKNIGPSVNTKGDEFYPHMSDDKTLYFSSTGHGGFGGLDIYVSHKSKESFSLPENLGFPLNTSSDDFALILDKSGRKGLFSSDRSGGVGYDDIYNFTVKSFFVVGKTIDRNDSSRTIPGVKIEVRNKQGLIINAAISDKNGQFYFDLDFDKDYTFSAAKQGYTWIDNLHYSTLNRVLGKDSLLIPLWPHSLFVKGSVYSNETQDKLQNATVTLENLTDNKVDTLVTSPTGAYNFLVIPSKKYRIRGQKEGYIPSEFELNTTKLLKGDLLNDLLLEELYTDKVILQFDFDTWEIKPEYKQEIEKLAKILNKNKNYLVHIGAYADARGTREYNLSLSNKRADEVVKFFENHGISIKRITSIGFGEELLINRCSDGVVCSQEEHSKNRRAELKIQLSKID